MLDWILERLPVVIFVVVFIAQILRGFFKTRGAKVEPPPRHDELEQDRRTREIQEEIRRKIAERRAGGRTVEPAQREEHEERPQPPVVQRDPTAIPDMPEPLKRMLEQLEKKVQPRSEPPVVTTPPMLERNRAEVERQERLAEEIRVLEEARATAARRAASIAAKKSEEARSHGALRSAARGRLLDDLHDPESLRRAFVLKEVLGTPVGLR